jgi:hypothetical protein
LELTLRPHLLQLSASVGSQVYGGDVRKTLLALDRAWSHVSRPHQGRLTGDDLSTIRKALNAYHHGNFGACEVVQRP